MHDVRSRIGPEAELGLVGWREQHLLQAIGPTTEFGFERDLGEQCEQHDRADADSDLAGDDHSSTPGRTGPPVST